MLENEPMGGDPNGADAATAAADNTTTPARRTRSTRRRAAQPEEGTVEAAETAEVSGADGREQDAVTGAEEPVIKVTRRLRKSAESAEPAAIEPAAIEPVLGAQAELTEIEPAEAEP